MGQVIRDLGDAAAATAAHCREMGFSQLADAAERLAAACEQACDEGSAIVHATRLVGRLEKALEIEHEIAGGPTEVHRAETAAAREDIIAALVLSQ